MSYDDQNIFAKILRGEIPNKTVYEDEYVLAFHDINPHTQVHALVIPKGAYTDIHDFHANATDAEITGYARGFAKTVEILGLHDNGFRTVANTGHHGGQEVPHYHSHILGGEKIGPMVSKTS